MASRHRVPVSRRSVRGPDLPILDVRLRTLTAPLEEPVAMACGVMERRAMALVEVESTDGLVGVGESWINHPPWAGTERRATIVEGIAPLLLGEDAAKITSLHTKVLQRLSGVARQWGGMGPLMQALSGVDIALWDLLGKALDCPVAALVGGTVRDDVPVYASGIGPEDVEAMTARCAAEGFTAVKLRVGFGHELDRANLAVARKVLGDDISIMVDANQAWSLPQALRMAPMLHEHGVGWVEEPVLGGELTDLEEFSRRSGLRVAAGENVYGCGGFLPYLTSRDDLVLQPDVSKVGGLSETLPVCHMAQASGKAVAPHFYGGAVALAATLQLAAACPAVSCVEFDVRPNPLRDSIGTGPSPVMKAGMVRLPSGPGLGVMVDPSALGAFGTDDQRRSR